MIHIAKNQEEISKILKIENMIVILNFHSETCGPCVMQMPVLEDISNDLKVTLVTFDVDSDEETLRHYNISATPTTHIYKNGKLVYSHVGFLPYERWNEEISKFQ